MAKTWEKRRERWDNYKRGVRDKASGKEPQSDDKNYMEGYNETRPHKISKYRR